MKRIPLAVLLLAALAASAQKTTQPNTNNIYATIDNVMLRLPQSQSKTTTDIAAYITSRFTTDSDKARAIYIWTAANLEYDADNMFALNFYEKREEKIVKALATRKGICEHYAAVFHELCQKSGLRSYVVEGYTKQNGFADYIPHAWCAAAIDGKWFLFDPTWGSGYLSNGKFVHKTNNTYYKVQPERMVRTHMPFDPMWEFMKYPVTNQEFYEGHWSAAHKTYFSYQDSITAYEKLSEPEQWAAAARRLQANGIKNSMIYDRLAHLKRNIEIYNNQQEVNHHNEQVNTYNTAVTEYNDGVNDFNTFIQYRNNQFKPMKADPQIQGMFDAGYTKLISAARKLAQIKQPDSNLAPLIVSLRRSIDEAKTHADEQKEWLQKYFSKGKFGRAGMFTKYTWMGIPLN